MVTRLSAGSASHGSYVAAYSPVQRMTATSVSIAWAFVEGTLANVAYAHPSSKRSRRGTEIVAVLRIRHGYAAGFFLEGILIAEHRAEVLERDAKCPVGVIHEDLCVSCADQVG